MSRFLTLSSGERVVVLFASLALLLAPLVLWTAGLGRLMRHFTRCRRTARKSRALSHLSSRRIVALVEGTAASLPWPSTCLHRSLVAAWLIRQADRPCRLVLGVAERAASDFAAHAWVALPDEQHHAAMTSPYTPIYEWAIAFSPQSR